MLNRISDEILIAAGRRSAKVDPERQLPDEDGYVDQIKQWKTEAEKIVASHPGSCLAAALGLGIVLGWWVKRT